ncbi:hypothetical protein [Acinetobacter sp. Ac_5812]|uniref:hypothetical protein n=1 Tax=Acinetobacter sp. Ac_5812 TaxID=1848937 RepID=UPI00148F56E7|nr:hypothetical protein [Acinetobacter sp. Ac_5812]NNP70951.1 hypothetical protein [Acinetobacter sp. Ac_5812]
MNAKTRTKAEILKSIDAVVERVLAHDASDSETANLLSFVVKELDPDLHAAIREENKRRYGK